jgi:hypothetical protein
LAFLITRNIAGALKKLILRGLDPADIPPAPPPESPGISVGTVITLLDGIIYALPDHVVNITVLTTAGTIEFSLNASSWETATLDANNNFFTSAVFIRSTGGDSDIVAKAF